MGYMFFKGLGGGERALKGFMNRLYIQVVHFTPLIFSRNKVSFCVKWVVPLTLEV